MENKQQIEKGIELLDELIPESLKFTKSLKQAERMMKEVYVPTSEIKYILGKMKYHNNDFAGLYCNQDAQHRQMIFKSMFVPYSSDKMPKKDTREGAFEHFKLQAAIARKQVNKWDYLCFEFEFLHRFCLMANNKNPLDFFCNHLKNIQLSHLFNESKLDNFGSYEIWANFWLFLSKNQCENEKFVLADYVFNS